MEGSVHRKCPNQIDFRQGDEIFHFLGLLGTDFHKLVFADDETWRCKWLLRVIENRLIGK
jgi:hypothetical protein